MVEVEQLQLAARRGEGAAERREDGHRRRRDVREWRPESITREVEAEQRRRFDEQVGERLDAAARDLIVAQVEPKHCLVATQGVRQMHSAVIAELIFLQVEVRQEAVLLQHRRECCRTLFTEVRFLELE